MTHREQGLQLIQPYIRTIADPDIRKFTHACLQVAPDYFWTIPSSSTGKYHPEWALGDAGLFRHTILVMYLCGELAGTFGLSPLERDMAISAGAIHDTLKYGIEYEIEYHHMHPYLPRTYYKRLDEPINPYAMVRPNVYNLIMDAVECHMGDIHSGRWSTVSKVKPTTPLEVVVHLADYTASRKKIHFQDFL